MTSHHSNKLYLIVSCYLNRTCLTLHRSRCSQKKEIPQESTGIFSSNQNSSVVVREAGALRSRNSHLSVSITADMLLSVHFSMRHPTLSTYFYPQRSLSNETFKRSGGFFYFRVTISLNNAWLWGGVAQALWGAEVHSWVKLYIIITAAEVATDGVSTTMSFTFSVLFNIRAYGLSYYLEYL